MSLTPPLCHMLRDPLLQARTSRYLQRAVDLAVREVERTDGQGRLHDVAQFYLERFARMQQAWEVRWARDLVTAFRGLLERGVLEIITCAATHGFLPLMENFPEAVRAQIFIARDHYREMFGRDPAGIWLPECAYVPGLDQVLQEANLRWFIVDAHGLMFGNPAPALRHLRAVLHAGGAGRVWARPRFLAPGLERGGGLSGRSGISRFLPRYRASIFRWNTCSLFCRPMARASSPASSITA